MRDWEASLAWHNTMLKATTTTTTTTTTITTCVCVLHLLLSSTVKTGTFGCVCFNTGIEETNKIALVSWLADIRPSTDPLGVIKGGVPLCFDADQLF